MVDSTSPTFFSYARQDAEFALRLARDLRSRGVSVWVDQLDIEAGERWDAAVEGALTRCPRVLVVLSHASTMSQNVMDEISYAIDEGKPIIPVLYEDCKVPFRLRRFQYADFRTDYAAGLQHVEEAVNGHAMPPVAPVVMPQAEPEPPPAVRAADSRWQRWLLLTPRKTTTGKVARVLFYFMLAIDGFYTLGIFLNGAGEFDWSAPGHKMGDVLGGYLLLFVLTAICWWLALRASAGSHSTRTREKDGAVRSAG